MFMNKYDFELSQNPHPLFREDYVEIDDLIGPTISLLNKKGYITYGSCGGHPFNKSFNVDSGLEKLGIQPVQTIVTSLRTTATRVFFSLVGSEYVTPPNNFISDVTPGATLFCRKLTQEEDELDYYKKYELLVSIHKELYDWVEGLCSKRTA